MKSLTVTTAKEDSLRLDEGPYQLASFEGYGDTEAENVLLQGIRQDGAVYVESFLKTKDIHLKIRLKANGEQDLNEMRQYTSQIFNPKNGLLTLVFSDESGEKQIQAISEFMPKFGGSDMRRDGIYQIVQVSLVAPSPYWRKTESIEQPLYSWIPNLRFPTTFGTATTKTTMFGTKGPRETIDNSGGDGAPVLITITGYVDTPTITNQTTGEYITLNTSIPAGQRVEINTDDNDLTIDLIDAAGVRTDIFSRMSIDSTLFKLVAGENVIEYTAIGQDEISTVSITYQELYAGI